MRLWGAVSVLIGGPLTTGSLAVALLVAAAGAVWAAPEVRQEQGVHVLENELLRAEVKYTELYRLSYKPTGQELMSPGWHGVLNIVAKGKPPGKDEATWLFQDSYQQTREYKTEVGETEATLSINFDWVWMPEQQAPYYAVAEQITILGDKPYLRVRYSLIAKQPPDPPPGSFMVQSSGTQGTHLVEPDGQLRIEELGEARLGGMRSDPNSYWFAYWDKPSGHFTAFLRPGQTDPTRCMFTRGQWYVSRWSEPFLDQPGQSYAEELWIVAGQTEGDDASQITRAAEDAYAFAEKHNPRMAVLQSPYVTHEELVEQTKHLRADGKGDHIVYKSERLYVDGRPFLLFAPWGTYVDRLPLYRKYHLTGLFGPARNLDAAAEHGLMLVTAALEWPSYRGKDLEDHIEKLKHHPATLAWFLADDFGGGLDMLANIEAIRKHETHVPTVADTVGYDAARRQASAFVDINAPYTYPAPVRTYRWYADYLEHNLKIMGRQFNWTCPQAASYSFFSATGQPIDYFNDYPSAAQMRLQTYLGLAHGIRGFMYWPGRALVDYKLSELGILCMEVEPVTDLIVEADKVPGGAFTDNEHIEVQRLDRGGHTLLFLINYRDESERWPTGELAPTFTVTVKGRTHDLRAHSMTFDKDLRVSQPEKLGEDLRLEVSGLDVAGMVLLSEDGPEARRRQAALEQKRAQAAEFATTTNRDMAAKVYELLHKAAGMQAPLGRAAQLYNEAVARIDREQSATGQRRIARLLRQAVGEALAQADRLADYVPSYAKNSLLINVWKLPQYWASFNFRALAQEAPPQLSPPPAIDPMAPPTEPVEPEPLEVNSILTAAEGRGYQGYVTPLQAQRAYCVSQKSAGISSGLHLHADEASYLAGHEDFVGLPNDNLSLTIFLCRPSEDMHLHLTAPKAREAFGVMTAQPLALGQEVTGPALGARGPAAAYEIAAAEGDSFEVTVHTDRGCQFDLMLCQAHARYGQVLDSGRTDGKEPLALRCTLPDEGPLTVLVERYNGDGGFTISAKRLEEKVLPQETENAFAGVRFALYGKNTNNFLEILAAHGIAGEHLSGHLAAADLSEYDVLILLTNAIKYDEVGELKASSQKLRDFVHDGGKLVLFQQNGRETWDPSVLPYDVELAVGKFTGEPLLADATLFSGLKSAEFPAGERAVAYYPIKVARTDENWRCLAYADDSMQQGLAAVCTHGRGQVMINQFAVLDRIGEPSMRSLMLQSVRYILESD